MAVFTAIAAFAASSFIAGVVVNVAISVGLSSLAQVLSGKKKKGFEEAPGFGVKATLDRGANVPQSFILGNYATAGTLTYANTSSEENSPNCWMNWVITLSDLPITDVIGVWVNGVWREISSPGSDGWRVISGYEKNEGFYLQMRFYDGTQTGADDWLTGEVSTDERPWIWDAVGRGKSYVVVRAFVEEELFQNGFPTFLFEVQGIPLYNPALDSSVGGSGSQRWSNPASWEISHNAAVQLYNVLRGIRYNGEWFYGLQDVDEAQLPADHWIWQIGIADQSVNGEPRYRAAAEVPVSAPINDVIESLLDACNGKLSDAGGIYKLFSGAPGLQPVKDFTDADIISTSGQSFTPFLGLSDTVNGVSAKYPSPASGWQIETAPPLYRPDYEAKDGGRRLLVDVSLDFVPFAEQAQRIMSAALNEARRARRHTITMPPEFWAMETGDIVTWTSERNEYDAKQFRIDGIIDLPNADVIFDLTEVNPDDYDWGAGDFIPPVIPGTDDQPIPVQQVQGFGVEPASVQDSYYKNRVPAIRAFWNPDVPDVRAIKMEIRITETQQMVDPATSETPSDGEVFISTSILPDTSYEVRAMFVPNSARPSEWTIWHEVTTWDILMEPDYLSDAFWDMIEQVAIDAADNMMETGNKWLEDLAENALSDLDTLLTSYESRDIIKGDLATAVQTFETEITAGKMAMASMNIDLQAQINFNLAEINQEMLVRADETSANASDITTLYSSVSDADGIISGQADAIDGLTTDVSNLDGEISAVSQSVTTLSGRVFDVEGEVVGVAGAVSLLETDVSSLGGVVSVNSSAITTLGSRVLNAEGQVSGQATAVDLLTTQVGVVDGKVTAQAGKITTVESKVGTNTTRVSQAMGSIDGIMGEYTLKINRNGIVTGMALRSSASAGTEVAFTADRFSIVNGPDQRQRKAPFIVYTSPTVIDGTQVAAGVYMRDAFMRDAQVTTIKIKGNAVTVPEVNIRNDIRGGTGAWVNNVQNQSIYLDFPGYVQVMWFGGHAYNNVYFDEPFNHNIRIKMNGQVVFERGGSAVNDYPFGGGMRYFNRGTVNVTVDWKGQAPLGARNLNLGRRMLTVMGVKR